MGDASNSKDGDGKFHVGELKEESFVENWIVLPSMYKKRILCLKKGFSTKGLDEEKVVEEYEVYMQTQTRAKLVSNDSRQFGES